MRKVVEKKWFAMFSGNPFAIQFFGCNSEKEVRRKAREWLGVERLPRGTEIWCNVEEVCYDC